jgi:hypothetical protein
MRQASVSNRHFTGEPTPVRQCVKNGPARWSLLLGNRYKIRFHKIRFFFHASSTRSEGDRVCQFCMMMLFDIE